MSAASPQRLIGRDPVTGRGLAVEIEGGMIKSVEFAEHGEQRWLSAGFVDLQVNGYAGHDLNGLTLDVATVRALCLALLKVGVTTFLPTIITAPEARIIVALRTIREACAAHPDVAAMVAGIHVEGPHIAPEDGPRGAHPAAGVRPPDIAEFDRWQQAAGGLVRLVTLSPHWPEAPAYVRHLVKSGVLVSLGHTSADAVRIAAAVDAGATLSTHLGNGSHALLDRRHNHLWPQLADDRLTAMFIADGHHLTPAQLKVMLRAKGPGRSLVVSDAVALGGLPPGKYQTPIGGRVELRADGFLALDDGTGRYLAGAASPLLAAIPMLVDQVGLTFGEALALVTHAPGRAIGGRGVMAVGQPADLVALEWGGGPERPRVVGVWSQGVAVE
ncbi:MAG: N-acetylglucosamine-6-phosphate deacetylase [Verrucomicrobiota bacterium]